MRPKIGRLRVMISFHAGGTGAVWSRSRRSRLRSWNMEPQCNQDAPTSAILLVTRRTFVLFMTSRFGLADSSMRKSAVLLMFVASAAATSFAKEEKAFDSPNHKFTLKISVPDEAKLEIVEKASGKVVG